MRPPPAPLQPGDLAVLARELGEGRVEQHRYVPLEDLVGLAQLRRLGARARELAVRGGGRRLGAREVGAQPGDLGRRDAGVEVAVEVVFHYSFSFVCLLRRRLSTAFCARR